MTLTDLRTLSRSSLLRATGRKPTVTPKKIETNFVPTEWQAQALADHSPVLLLTGSAGGGKSRTGLEILHRYLQTYPGATGLMMRKAREWTEKSIVAFLKQAVIGNSKVAVHKKSDRLFEYPSSTLYYGGMKDNEQRESIRSIGGDGGLDIVLFEEANAFTENDFNEVLARMRGKAAPYRQIILMTNPDSPNHWINQRLIIGGQAKVYYSSVKDNPFNPSSYLDELNKMTGMLYQRLVLGRWIQAEGVVYDNFTPEFNMNESAEYNPDLDVIWGIDDGYVQGGGPGTLSYHPRVILFGQVTSGGVLNIFQEHYETGNPSYQSTISAVAEFGYPKPRHAYIDSSAQMFKGALWQVDIFTIGATHKVYEGIKNLRQMICDGQNVRRVIIHPRCKNLIREILSYRYGDSPVATVGEQKPLKLDDHGPDALRYMAWHLRNP